MSSSHYTGVCLFAWRAQGLKESAQWTTVQKIWLQRYFDFLTWVFHQQLSLIFEFLDYAAVFKQMSQVSTTYTVHDAYVA